MTTKQRRFPRVGSVVLKAHVRFGQERFDAYVTSLGEGGAFLVTERRLGVGRLIGLVLRLPFGLGPVELEAKTVYAGRQPEDAETRLAGFGIEFVGMGEREASSLRRYVETFRAVAAQLENENARAAELARPDRSLREKTNEG